MRLLSLFRFSIQHQSKPTTKPWSLLSSRNSENSITDFLKLIGKLDRPFRKGKLMKMSIALFTVLFLVSGPAFCQHKPANLEENVDSKIEKMFTDYNQYWSDGNSDKISQDIYGVPFSLFLQDKTVVFDNPKAVKDFLVSTFNELDKNNYGHSKRNGWEHYKIGGNLAVIEMNFTRYLKNGDVMGPPQRTATYILRKKGDNYRIVGIVSHTTVGQ